jgi:hypothetical protein
MTEWRGLRSSVLRIFAGRTRVRDVGLGFGGARGVPRSEARVIVLRRLVSSYPVGDVVAHRQMQRPMLGRLVSMTHLARPGCRVSKRRAAPRTDKQRDRECLRSLFDLGAPTGAAGASLPPCKCRETTLLSGTPNAARALVARLLDSRYVLATSLPARRSLAAIPMLRAALVRLPGNR